MRGQLIYLSGSQSDLDRAIYTSPHEEAVFQLPTCSTNPCKVPLDGQGNCCWAFVYFGQTLTQFQSCSCNNLSLQSLNYFFIIFFVFVFFGGAKLSVNCCLFLFLLFLPLIGPPLIGLSGGLEGLQKVLHHVALWNELKKQAYTGLILCDSILTTHEGQYYSLFILLARPDITAKVAWA